MIFHDLFDMYRENYESLNIKCQISVQDILFDKIQKFKKF